MTSHRQSFCWTALLAVVCWLGFATPRCAGASVALHQLGAPQLDAAGVIQIPTSGEPPSEYAPYFDLHLLEGSTDLQHWFQVDARVRTNATATLPIFLETTSENQAFFRSVTNLAPTPFPLPTGPYRVGTFSRLLSSSTRKSNALGPNRQFMVSIFYPAAPAPAKVPRPFLEPIWGTVLFSKEFLYVVRPANVPTNLVGQAAEDLPLMTGTNQLPVLLYFHGGQYFRRDNLQKLTELASHGYVVVTADFYDAWFSILPDGTPAVFDPQTDYAHTTLNGALHDGSMGDTRFLLDQLAQINLSDPTLRGRLDLNRIGVVGWSFGGGVAADICRADPRVKVAVLYDTAFWSCPDVTSQGLSKPFLCIHSTKSPSPDWATPAVNLVNRATRDAMFFQIQDARHRDFSDLILVDEPNLLERQLTQRINAFTLAFFNHYLLGTDEPLLNAPPSDPPAVVNWIKK